MLLTKVESIERLTGWCARAGTRRLLQGRAGLPLSAESGRRDRGHRFFGLRRILGREPERLGSRGCRRRKLPTTPAPGSGGANAEPSPLAPPPNRIGRGEPFGS